MVPVAAHTATSFVVSVLLKWIMVMTPERVLGTSAWSSNVGNTDILCVVLEAQTLLIGGLLRTRVLGPDVQGLRLH